MPTPSSIATIPGADSGGGAGVDRVLNLIDETFEQGITDPINLSVSFK